MENYRQKCHLYFADKIKIHQRFRHPLFADESGLHVTIGIRYRKEQRTVLKRQIKEIETPLGKLQVKEVEIDGEKRCYPEYESAKKLALKHQCSLQEIYHLVK